MNIAKKQRTNSDPSLVCQPRKPTNSIENVRVRVLALGLQAWSTRRLACKVAVGFVLVSSREYLHWWGYPMASLIPLRRSIDIGFPMKLQSRVELQILRQRKRRLLGAAAAQVLGWLAASFAAHVCASCRIKFYLFLLLFKYHIYIYPSGLGSFLKWSWPKDRFLGWTS